MTALFSFLPRVGGLLLLATLLPACTQRMAAPVPAAAVPHRPRTVSTIPINTAPTDTVLVFQRTPCYGRCPSYTATIFRNGRVAYTGERSVPLLGPHELHLDPATVAAMLTEARRINFNQFAPSYPGNADLPNTIITVFQPGQQRHQVSAGLRFPAPLQAYIDYLQHELDPLAGLSPQK